VAKILKGLDIADRCSLIEALYWCAFREYPIKNHFETEELQDDELIEEVPFNLKMLFTEKFCKQYNFPTNYYVKEFKYENDNSSLSPPYKISTWEEVKMIGDKSLNNEDIEKLKKEIKSKEKNFYTRQKPFEDALEAYLEIYKAQLFTDLRKGNVKSYGRLKNKEHSTSLNEYKELKAEVWRLNNIVWESNFIKKEDNNSIYNIRIDTKSLFESYKESNVKKIKYISESENILVDEENNKVEKRGRSEKINWNMVHAYICLHIIQDKTVFNNQDAFSKDVEDWISKEFGVTISPSAIKDRLKPYWDMIKRTDI
jgi:hypothetical protein